MNKTILLFAFLALAFSCNRSSDDTAIPPPVVNQPTCLAEIDLLTSTDWSCDFDAVNSKTIFHFGKDGSVSDGGSPGKIWEIYDDCSGFKTIKQEWAGFHSDYDIMYLSSDSASFQLTGTPNPHLFLYSCVPKE